MHTTKGDVEGTGNNGASGKVRWAGGRMGRCAHPRPLHPTLTQERVWRQRANVQAAGKTTRMTGTRWGSRGSGKVGEREGKREREMRKVLMGRERVRAVAESEANECHRQGIMREMRDKCERAAKREQQ